MNVSTFMTLLTPLDLTVFSINFFIFLFSHWIVKGFKSTDSQGFSARVWMLRVFNLVLFALYLVAFYETAYARRISLTGLTLLLGFLAIYFLRVLMVRRFGRVREIEGEKIRSETYQSEIFGLINFLIVAVVCLLVLINIWEITGWLQATSVLGGLLLLLYSTKDVWAPENINGLILLYNGDVEPGSVIRIDELNLLAITLQISLTQTVFRDIRHRHRIIIPNSRVRNSLIEILSDCPAAGLRQFVDFKIGYSNKRDQVEAMLMEVWKTACQNENAINKEKLPTLLIIETGDHAVTWRLVYTLANVYRLLEAEFALKSAAHDVSVAQGIGLDTPLTHKVDLT